MFAKILTAGAFAASLMLVGCGDTAGSRALSGGAIGAAGGAAIGAMTGTPATGAAIGAGVGAAAGAVTTPSDCDKSHDWWDSHGGPRAYHERCDR